MSTAPRLRAMSIGDMFDAAFRLYREHFLTFIGVVALVQVPMAIVQFLMQFVVGRAATLDVLRFSARPPVILPGSNPFAAFPVSSFLTFYGITLGIAIFQGLIVQSLITGALANAISRSYLGRPISILDSYRFGVRRYLALIGASVLLLLIGAALILLYSGCAVGAVAAGAAALRNSRSLALASLVGVLVVALLFILLIPTFLFFFIRFILTTQAIVLEGCGPLAGLRRSWRLIGSAFWRALGIFVLVILLSYLISVIPSLMVVFGLNLLSGGAIRDSDIIRNQALGSLVAQVGLIVALPLLFSIYTLLYYDLRVRKEGYDLELMAQQANVP
jgi:hypothetical protein